VRQERAEGRSKSNGIYTENGAHRLLLSGRSLLVELGGTGRVELSHYYRPETTFGRVSDLLLANSRSW
jgi:hypothetical protein